MSSQILIREFQPNDAKRLSAIMRENFVWFNKKTPGWVHGGVKNWMRDNNPDELKQRHENGETHFLVAEKNGKPIGLVGLQIKNQIGKIVNLYVASQFRQSRLRVGTQLMDHAQAHATQNGVQTLFLYGALPTHDFYVKSGYQHKPEKDIYENRSRVDAFSKACSCGHKPRINGRVDQYFFEKDISN